MLLKDEEILSLRLAEPEIFSSDRVVRIAEGLKEKPDLIAPLFVSLFAENKLLSIYSISSQFGVSENLVGNFTLGIVEMMSRLSEDEMHKSKDELVQICTVMVKGYTRTPFRRDLESKQEQNIAYLAEYSILTAGNLRHQKLASNQ